MLVATWVWKYNLNSLLDEVARLAGEELDFGIRIVVVGDIEASDGDASPPRWAGHRFDGPNPVEAEFAIDQGADVLHVRLDLPDTLAERAEAMLELMQTYRLQSRG